MPAHFRFVPRLTHPITELLETLGALVTAIAFWIAIVLPLVYPAVLLVPDTAGPEAIGAIIMFHATALLVGHGHVPA